MNKIAVITGTSSGLGSQIAVQMAQQGYKVYATMRNLAKKSPLEALAKKTGVSLQMKCLDVEDVKSIKRCIQEIIEEEQRIDVFVNNAGAGFVKTTEQATEEEIRKIININFMSVIFCCKEVIPFMRKQREGRIINISSVGGLVGQPFNEVYCAAKFGVEGYTESLATYLEDALNIKFTVIEPGGIVSQFSNKVLENLKNSQNEMPEEYVTLFNKFLSSPMRSEEGVYQTADEVAQVVIKCVLEENPPLRVRTSEWANSFCNLKIKTDPTGKLITDNVKKVVLATPSSSGTL